MLCVSQVLLLWQSRAVERFSKSALQLFICDSLHCQDGKRTVGHRHSLGLPPFCTQIILARSASSEGSCSICAQSLCFENGLQARRIARMRATVLAELNPQACARLPSRSFVWHPQPLPRVQGFFIPSRIIEIVI